MEFLYSGTSEQRTHLLSFVERSSSPQVISSLKSTHIKANSVPYFLDLTPGRLFTSRVRRPGDNTRPASIRDRRL